MNSIANEIKSYIGSAQLTDEEFLEHYGMPRRSGRYPWGSGKKDYQHSIDFLGRIEQLREKGWKETPENIERDFGLSVKEYRMEKTLCLNERRLDKVATAERLRVKEGLNNTEIAKRMGINESSVRSLLNEKSKEKMLQARNTANYLKEQIKEKKMIDVGADVERELNISREKFDTALYMLQSEGYGVYSNRIPQATNKNQLTTQKVLVDKDIKPAPGQKVPKEIYQYDKIQTLKDYISRDGGDTFEKKFHYPSSLNSKRMLIRYADDKGPDGFTGNDKDGIIELRRGVPDLSLGESRYAQVRILVDGTHYAKGMAVYSDKMPDGIDVIFNTSKGKNVPMKSADKDAKQVLKPIKNDPENPFGSAIKDVEQGGQYWYTDKNGKKKLGLINKRSDEGDWTEWKDALPSQFLSKQSPYLAKKQLELAKANKMDEFEAIRSLTNPTIKKYYLDKFASECDKAAVDLKAAALPGQKYHVIIPVNSLKETEIYAPQYKEGTKVALIRYPHGGRFEIPVLTVNNKNPNARKIIGTDSIDAVGITKKVADRLSGADFDGDTVMVIPTDDRRGKVKISRRDQLDGLVGFDNKVYQYDTKSADGKHYYKNGKEFKIMKNTDNQMGRISNLITDMTLLGANDDELARAVRHSMVVIDAEKHKLDYKRSEIENDIASLKKKYQQSYDENGNLKYGGASTIVSRAKGDALALKTRGQAKINEKGKSWYDPSKPEGALIKTLALPKDLYYAESTLDKKTGINAIKTKDGKTIRYNLRDPKERAKYDPVMHINKKTGEVYFTNKDGSIEYRKKARTTTSTRMAETDDAMTLVSPHKHEIELLYADYANTMKAMANTARKEYIKTPALEYNPRAKKVYAKEVSELEARLNEAMKNSPKERAAQRMTAVEVRERKRLNPDMKGDDERKLSQRTVTKYRKELGTINRRSRAITISDKEWEAIQAGAISENKLKKILQYSDADSLRQRAMPTNKKGLNTAQINRIKRMADSNYTLQQIADAMGISTSAVSKYLKGE
jgi:DNA-binding CsgD family transcriptional regulator